MATLDEQMFGGLLTDPLELKLLQQDFLAQKQSAAADALRGTSLAETPQASTGGFSGGLLTHPNYIGLLTGPSKRRSGRETLAKAAAAQAGIEGQEAKQAILRRSVEKLRQEALAKEALTEGRDYDKDILTEQRLYSEGLTRSKNQREDRPRTRVPFHDPADPDNVINLLDDGRGGYTDMQGNAVDAGSLTPYSSGATQSTAQIKAEAAAADDSADLSAKIRKADTFGADLVNPLLKDATGNPLIDPKRLAAEVTPLYPDVQSMQVRLQNAALTAAAPLLELLGPRPTDQDLKEAFRAGPGIKNEPATWIDWYKGAFKEDMRAQMNKQGVSETDQQMIFNNIDMTAAEAEQVHYPEGRDKGTSGILDSIFGKKAPEANVDDQIKEIQDLLNKGTY